MLLLVADGLMICGFIVLELLHVGPAAFKVLFCGIGRGIELYVPRNDLTVHISQLGLSYEKNWQARWRQSLPQLLYLGIVPLKPGDIIHQVLASCPGSVEELV